jgi:hypothetical protein
MAVNLSSKKNTNEMTTKKEISIRQVTLKNPPGHINEFLTHWTGRKKSQNAFDILSKIVDSCELKFSINKISFPRAEWKASNEMICFTDTPISQSFEHCKRYGHFGISFNKKELIEYGASPVLYILDNRRKHQEYIKEIIGSFIFPDNHTRSLFTWYASIGQPYNTGNISQYAEREWRIIRILPKQSIMSQEETQGQFNEYPFKGTIRRNEISTQPLKEEYFLKFSKNLIENIIVPKSHIEEGKKLLKRNGLNCELIVLN